MMTKLLINESPVQLLPSLAFAIGEKEAMFLQQLHYWLQHSHHKEEGRLWVYNTYKEWHRQFWWWDIRTVRRVVDKLKERGIIITAHLSKTPFDRTLWYSIDYEKLAEIEAEVKPQIDAIFDEDKMNESIGAICPHPSDSNDMGVGEMSQLDKGEMSTSEGGEMSTCYNNRLPIDNTREYIYARARDEGADAPLTTTDDEAQSVRDKVRDVLEASWGTVNFMLWENHIGLVERYGYEAWHAGFHKAPRSARHNKAYVEKCVITAQEEMGKQEEKAEQAVAASDYVEVEYLLELSGKKHLSRRRMLRKDALSLGLKIIEGGNDVQS
jgi:hypothetical protein